jgi:hypothetical protein
MHQNSAAVWGAFAKLIFKIKTTVVKKRISGTIVNRGIA